MSGCRLYIGRLSDSARDRDVERFFKGYGRIRELLLKEGYGFIEFHESRDAEDAVYDLNGKELCGDRIVLEFAKPPGSRNRGGDGRSSGGRGYGSGYGGGYDRGSREGGYGDDRYGGGYRGGASARPRNPPPLRTPYRVNVENLSSRVSWQDLKDYMREAGEVTYADAHKLRPNEGVVEFASRKDMETAISTMDGKEINGRKITVTEDKSTSRKRSRSRSDSRDRRSNSRSRSRSKGGRRTRSRSASAGGKSRSRSPAPKKGRSNSYDAADKRRSHSKSRSPSHRKDSRSRSPVEEHTENKNGERTSRSHSRSRSPLAREETSVDHRSSRSPAAREGSGEPYDRKSSSRSRSGSRN